MKSSDIYFEIRKALAWSACHKMKRIWSTKLQRKIKERLFTLQLSPYCCTEAKPGLSTK